MDAAIQKSSIVNLPAWFLERFPPINVISAFVMFFMLAVATRAELGLSYRIRLTVDLCGALALTALFLLMRVSDEFKDFEVDSVNYPNRVLQSGAVELRHLLAVGVAAVFVMVLVSWIFRGEALWFCLLNLILVGLMNREFFCGDWLREHIVFYALSHMVVATTASLWVLSLIAPGTHLAWPLLALVMLPYFCGMAFEFARKSFGLEENKPTLESYTRILDVGRAMFGLAVALLAAEVGFAFVMKGFYPSHFIFGLAVSLPLWLVAVWSVARFKKHPQKNNRKLCEATVGLFILVNYLSIVGLGLWT